MRATVRSLPTKWHLNEFMILISTFDGRLIGMHIVRGVCVDGTAVNGIVYCYK